MLKWFMVLVLPGIFETLASSSLLVSMLISDDLPTLECPMTATSGPVSRGMRAMVGLLVTKRALRISHWLLGMLLDCCLLLAGSQGSKGLDGAVSGSFVLLLGPELLLAIAMQRPSCCCWGCSRRARLQQLMKDRAQRFIIPCLSKCMPVL